jgi:hypothetical protein
MKEMEWREGAGPEAKEFTSNYEDTCRDLDIDTSSIVKEEYLADVWYVNPVGADQYLGTLDLINPTEYRVAHPGEMKFDQFYTENRPMWINSPNYGEQVIPLENLKIIILKKSDLKDSSDDHDTLDDIFPDRK